MALVALAAVQVFLLRRLARPGEPFGDDLSLHFAEAAHLARALRAGDFSFWNPTGNLGFASAYYYQFVPQFVAATLIALAPGPSWALMAFKLTVALPLVLLPISCFWALRMVRVPRASAIGAAAAAGFIFSDSPWGLGMDSTFTYGLFTQAWGLLFFPLAIATTFRWLSIGRGLAPAMFFILLTAFCHPLVAVAAIPAVVLMPWWHRSRRRALGRGAVLMVMLVAGAAFFWLPMLVHYDSFGGFPVRIAGESGVAPGTFARRLISGAWLDEGRAPILTVLLFVSLFFARRSRLLAFVLRLAALYAGVVVAGPLLARIPDDILPATRFLPPFQLTCAIAGGTAAATLVMKVLGRGRRIAGAVLVVAAFAAWQVVAAAVVHADKRVRTTDDLPPNERAQLHTMIETLRTMPPGRLVAGREFGTPEHWWMYLPAAYAQKPALRAFGAAAFEASTNLDFLRELNPGPSLAVLGARYLLATARSPLQWDLLPGAVVVARTSDYLLATLPFPGYFQPVGVHGAIRAGRKDRRADVRRWRETINAGFHPREIGPLTGLAASGSAARVLAQREGLSRYEAEVQVDDKLATVALMVTFHPGWSAKIDGQSTRIRRLTPDIMAIDVPRGSHSLVFVFRRPWWGWLLAATTALLLAGAFLRERRLNS